jgi:heterodisulfide reductase subunit C
MNSIEEENGSAEEPRTVLSQKIVRGEFGRRVDELSGQQLYACYQCGNCSSGCPLADEMDLLPNMVMRLCQLGQKDELLSSQTIWICASCFQCTVRCPKGIDIEQVMDALRQLALDEGVDHFGPDDIDPELAAEVPQPGLVSAYRKLST